MSARIADRPTADEHIPYYGQYISLAPGGDIIATLERQVTETTRFLGRLTQEKVTRHPAPGEWSILDIIVHLSDTERVFSCRALRLARGDTAPPENVEFEDYAAVADGDKRALTDTLAEFASVRSATVALLRGLDAAAWARRAPEETWTCRSVRAFAYVLAGHEIHHLNDIQRQLGEPEAP